MGLDPLGNLTIVYWDWAFHGVWALRLISILSGSPILQLEVLYYNWAWIYAKLESTISQLVNKLIFYMISNLMVNF